jgi:hypothetical protein
MDKIKNYKNTPPEAMFWGCKNEKKGFFPQKVN